MGAFPINYEIPLHKLISLWTVEDFLERNETQTLQDFAMECLENLVSQSLVFFRKDSSNNRIKSCKLHSTYWHLCVNEARKIKFLHVFNVSTHDFNECMEYMESERRLCIQNNVLFGIKEAYDPMATTLRARSLLFTCEYHQYPIPVGLDLMVFLKVLDALAIRFYEFPKEVLELLQLKYLALTHNGNLSSLISKLQSLQNLIVSQHHNMKLVGETTCLPKQIWDPAIFEIGKCRRLSIHSHVVEFIRTRAKGPKVRSFLCFSKETVNLPTECIPSIPEAFKLLRVIDASPIKFTKFPLKLTRLIHLRYITMSGNDLKALPKDVSKLWNLQTVRIDTTSREFEIKADIGKMKQLRHLKSKAAIVLKEVQGEGGENLQTLSRLSTKSFTEEVFNRAKNLKNLGIRGDLATIVNKDFLEKLERLEKLKLVHNTFPMDVSGTALHRLPPADSFPPNMRILTLSSTSLPWAHMTTLGSLHKLEVLKLKEMAFKGRRWEVEGSGFCCLKSLHIAHTDLEIWMTGLGDPFPKLKHLILKNCEKLQKIPSRLGNNLQFLELESVMKRLVESAKNIKAAKEQTQGHLRGRKGGFKLIISPKDLQY